MTSTAEVPYLPHSSHWGPYRARVIDGELEVQPDLTDIDPTPLLGNIASSVTHPARVTQPMVRRGWLEHGPGPGRRDGDFVAVSWETALELTSAELQRVRSTFGNESIYGGSYGWSSTGRFHHAQSQVHRFLNMFGGYVRSVNTYSAGTAEVLLPHIIAPSDVVVREWTTWDDIEGHTDLILAFGGIPRKNTFVGGGGVADHIVQSRLTALIEHGTEVVSLSPLRDDFPTNLFSQWIPVRPFGDVPLILALSFVLIQEQLQDEDFLQRCTVGFGKYRDYLLGVVDGQPKTPEWAAQFSGVGADQTRALARRAARSRTLVNVTFSLQRSEHGEQPVWAALALAALLGQIGLQGGGFSFGIGSLGNNGKPPMGIPVPALPQGSNAVRDFIPVARVADMLLNPGQPFDYNGQHLTYPDIKLVYWAGGNPFHHHQDLFRLRDAFSRPDTIVVHEQYWTSTARSADIVLPATVTLERRDLGAGRNDSRLIAMNQVLQPHAEARDDYTIFTDLSRRLGFEQEFTEGRTAEEWLQKMYADISVSFRAAGVEAPSFDEFWERGTLDIPARKRDGLPLAAFRADPVANPLITPSGRIEIFSETIAGFGYDDCPGHPTWLDSSERVTTDELAAGFLQLIANNPASRLHSQLDVGTTSQDSKIAGREPIRLNPADAAARSITLGDIVVVSSVRGKCLAGAFVSPDVLQGTAQLSTGAWFEPVDVGGEEI